MEFHAVGLKQNRLMLYKHIQAYSDFMAGDKNHPLFKSQWSHLEVLSKMFGVGYLKPKLSSKCWPVLLTHETLTDFQGSKNYFFLQKKSKM